MDLVYIGDLASDLGMKWPSTRFSEWLRRSRLRPVSSYQPFAFERAAVLKAVGKG